MPDDNPEFRASQGKHAEFIKTSRAISQITGKPPWTIRRALRQVERSQAPPKQLDPPRPVSESLPRPAQGTRIEPRPFRPDPNGGANQGLLQSQGAETFIVVIDGVAKYYNFDATYVSDV